MLNPGSVHTYEDPRDIHTLNVRAYLTGIEAFR